MPKLDDRALSLLNDLLKLGDEVLATRRDVGSHIWIVDRGLHAEWVTRAVAFTGRIFGKESDYYRAIAERHMTSEVGESPRELLHHLKAIKADIQAGALDEVTKVIEADVFDDLLEQAEHLWSVGYHAPSAVIAGCVLEDALRRTCHREGILLPDHPKLDTMNSALAKAGIYPKLIQKKITALADIRNSAAHGKWDEFTAADVNSMLRDVRDVVIRHFT